MAILPKSDPTHHSLTATELLAIRGTPEFESEIRRQASALAKSPTNRSAELAEEFMNWDAPGWTYNAEL